MLIERLGVPARRIFSIPTGVELAEFAPQEKSPELLAQVQIPADAFIFGSVAVLRSWKGHLDLLEAFHELLQEGARAFLLLVGEGPYRVVIEEKIAQLGLQHRVRLAGFRDQVAPWFALMDVKVLASYANEGVPQSLLQAQAMARPVVGTTVGGIPEVIVDEETGLLVPPRDPRALAQAMGRLMADPDYRRELGRRGRELVVERFSMEQMAAEIEAVYEVLRARAGKGRAGDELHPGGLHCLRLSLGVPVPGTGSRLPGIMNFSLAYHWLFLAVAMLLALWGASLLAVRLWTRHQVIQDLLRQEGDPEGVMITLPDSRAEDRAALASSAVIAATTCSNGCRAPPFPSRPSTRCPWS